MLEDQRSKFPRPGAPLHGCPARRHGQQIFAGWVSDWFEAAGLFINISGIIGHKTGEPEFAPGRFGRLFFQGRMQAFMAAVLLPG